MVDVSGKQLQTRLRMPPESPIFQPGRAYHVLNPKVLKGWSICDFGK